MMKMFVRMALPICLSLCVYSVQVPYGQDTSAHKSLESKRQVSFGSHFVAVTTQDGVSSHLDSSKTTKSHFLYRPIAVSRASYGSFSIGYTQTHIKTQSINVTDDSTNVRIARDFNLTASGVLFGLERGIHWGNVMLGGYINGVAAQDYALSFGARTSYLIARYVVPSVGIGWKLQHTQFPNDMKQYNIHGLNINAGLFVNIAHGFGLKLDGSYSYPLVILRGVNAHAYGDPAFSGYAFAVSVCLYDFSI